jgi:L-amino acid N-acyltransferase YncA
MDEIIVREMFPNDWERVKSIYEQGIETGVATFETTTPTWEKWDSGHLKYGRLVATINNSVVGWAALSPVSSRCVYGGVAELSVYTSDKHRGKGVGKKLLQQLIAESETNGIWTLQAGIFQENEASVKLHEGVGFRIIGIREKIGKLKGTWRNNYILERRSKIVGIE